jgi:hypothetical protein
MTQNFGLKSHTHTHTHTLSLSCRFNLCFTCKTRNMNSHGMCIFFSTKISVGSIFYPFVPHPPLLYRMKKNQQQQQQQKRQMQHEQHQYQQDRVQQEVTQVMQPSLRQTQLAKVVPSPLTAAAAVASSIANRCRNGDVMMTTTTTTTTTNQEFESKSNTSNRSNSNDDDVTHDVEPHPSPVYVARGVSLKSQRAVWFFVPRLSFWHVTTFGTTSYNLPLFLRLFYMDCYA